MHNQRTHLVTALVPGQELQSAADQARAGERLASSTLKLWSPIRLGGVAVRRNNEVGKNQARGAEPTPGRRWRLSWRANARFWGQGD